MKKVVFMSIIFLIVSFGYAQHYVMKLNLRNGTIDTIRVADLSKIHFDLTPVKIDESEIPNMAGVFKLLSNYPNPFNPSTIIQYHIPKPGKVEISIYDINGKLIRTMVNSSQVPGVQNAEWDGKNAGGQNAASGHYVYTVKFEQRILSKKMILLK